MAMDKYDGRSYAKLWLKTYSTAIRAAHDTTDQMAAYFPVMMNKVRLLWLEGCQTTPLTTGKTSASPSLTICRPLTLGSGIDGTLATSDNAKAKA